MRSSQQVHDILQNILPDTPWVKGNSCTGLADLKLN